MDGMHINIGTNRAKNVAVGQDRVRAGDTYHGDQAPPEARTPDGRLSAPRPPAPEPSDRAVFVVHGRDTPLRRAMFGFLRALDLAPLEWESLVEGVGGAAPYVGDVVLHAPSRARAAVVLLSPDDIVRLHPDLINDDDPGHERQPAGQARPNVLLELGMVLTAYPERTIIVEAGALRPVGDLAGRHVIRLDGSTRPLHRIRKRLEDAGCAVNASGEDWLDLTRFADLAAYRRRPA